MIKVEHAVTIDKPVEEVFTFVNNPDNTSIWQSGVEAVKYQDSPPKVGTQYTEVRKFMGREMETTLEITALEPNKMFSAKTIEGPVPFDVTIIFESEGDGTKMTTKIEGEPGGFFKLAQGMVVKQLEKSLKEDSEHLKGLLENS